MKHLIPNHDLENNFAGAKTLPTVLACQRDDGHFYRNKMYRLGEGGAIWLFPCEACNAMLVAQVLEPLVLEAMKSKTLQERK